MKKGFTLIELLIVVAIIAILAAIAVPNFLEAQVRSKIARVKSDMRTVATALEAYAVDKNNQYPFDGQGQIPTVTDTYAGVDISDNFGVAHLNNMLTTPIAYLTTSVGMKDPFNAEKGDAASSTFRYVNVSGTYLNSTDTTRKANGLKLSNVYGAWMLASFGPDKSSSTSDPSYSPAIFWVCLRYDASNGTVSKGDVIRAQKTAEPIYPATL